MCPGDHRLRCLRSRDADVLFKAAQFSGYMFHLAPFCPGDMSCDLGFVLRRCSPACIRCHALHSIVVRDC